MKGPLPTRPVGSVETAERLVHTIKWVDEASQKRGRPEGVKGTDIYSIVLAQGAPVPAVEDFVYVVNDTASPYRREFAPSDGGKIAHYLLRYVLNDNTKGSWSERITATIVAA